MISPENNTFDFNNLTIHAKTKNTAKCIQETKNANNLTIHAIQETKCIQETECLKNSDILLLKSVLSNRLFYISHPSLSGLECSFNLSNCIISPEFFDHVVEEIMKLDFFNVNQVEKKYNTFSIIFKDVAALKILNFIFKDQPFHVLYPLYLKWVEN